jgi:hypothetical protein
MTSIHTLLHHLSHLSLFSNTTKATKATDGGEFICRSHLPFREGDGRMNSQARSNNIGRATNGDPSIHP